MKQQPVPSANTIGEALSITARAVKRRAARENWPFQEQTVRGGTRRLYIVASLPADVRDAFLSHLIESAPAHPALPEQEPSALSHPETRKASAPVAALSTRGVASHVTSPATALAEASPRSNLTDRQREVLDARAAIVAEVKRLGASVGVNRAIHNLLRFAAAGELPEQLQRLVPIANAKRAALSRRTVFRWMELAKQDALAPAIAGRDYTLSEEVAAVLALSRQPNKPSLAWCAQEVARGLGADWKPLYHRASRFRDKLPKSLFYVGRHTGAALKALQPFKRRDFLSLNPNDVWVGDGHGAKLKVAHPITGSPFVPEVTVIMDVATRYVVGWSVALSENCLAVADALRHGIARHGVPLVYYSDNGGGQKNQMFDAPITGTLGALGIHHETGRPGNPQGRGVIERFWQTALITLARRFDTFQGRGADRETLKKVTHEIDRTLRAVKSGEVVALPKKLPTWPQFLEALNEALDDYNGSHRHRSLPRINGELHPTPAEFRAARLQGIEIQKPQGAELATLFMPSIIRKAARGEVRLFNGLYFHKDLMLVDGEQVQVAYDIHDASRVWVKKISGELIAEAALDGNRDGYMPQPLIERLREDRAQRRMGRLQSQMNEVQAELAGSTLAAQLEPIETPAEPEVRENIVVLPGARQFEEDIDLYRWMLDRPGEVTQWQRDYIKNAMERSLEFTAQVAEEDQARKSLAASEGANSGERESA